QRVEVFGDVIVRFDLGGGWRRRQTQTFDELGRERRPVDVGVGGEVSAVVADRAVSLAEQGYGRELVALTAQAADEYREFLADGGRRGRLAVGAREHRLLGITGGGVGDQLKQLVD